jgi:Immunity protein 26
MVNKYPFSPKSNIKLEIGEFWAIKLSNGKYGCGVILDLPSKEDKNTKGFFIGLLNWVSPEKPSPLDLETTEIRLLEQGEAHIKTITKRDEQIIGKINLDKTNITIPFL